MGSWLERVRQVLQALEDALLTIALTATLLLAIGQILLRNIWHTGISWADPSLRVLILWIALLGAMAATRNSNHIRIDIIPRYLSLTLRSYNDRITDLFAATVCAILAWHSARFVLFEYEDGSLLFAALPAWACELILPLGFGVMALRFFIATLGGRRSHSEPEL
jgi:TRAP-type C4-dicarboxylate transport system permease small subunit